LNALQALPNDCTLEHIKGEAHHADAVVTEVGHGAKPARIDRQVEPGLIQGNFAAQLVRIARQNWPALPRSTGFLLMLNLVLAAVIVAELTLETDYSTDTLTAPTVHANVWPKSERMEFHPPSDHLLDVISQRPLFEPSRRPHVPQIVQSSGAEESPIELIGTFLSDSGRAALVRLGAQEHAVWVAERGYISDWQVEGILADRLHLRRIDERRVIYLWPKRESQAH